MNSVKKVGGLSVKKKKTILAKIVNGDDQVVSRRDES